MPRGAVRWVEASARVAPADVEAVADAFRAAGAAGVAIEPAIHVSDAADFAYEELDAPATVRASFAGTPPPAARRALRRRLNALTLAQPLPPLRYLAVGAHAWSEEWKRFYHVQHIGRRLVMRPSWEAYAARPGELVIELDPGTAFGTGQHATTRLCLVAIERALHGAPAVLELGAGSGILAIAAAKLGARSVHALDNDPETVAIARENARRNGLGGGTAGRITFAAGSLGSGWPWPRRPQRACADLLIANISSTVVVAMMPAFARALRPGGVAILSGFIARDAAEMRAAARAAGLRPLRTDAEAEWRCLVAQRPAQ